MRYLKLNDTLFRGNLLKSAMPLYFLAFLFLAPLSSFATHLLGGHIYWERISANEFIIMMDLYGDTSPGVAPIPTSWPLSSNSPLSSITVYQTHTTSYSSNCTNSSFANSIHHYESDTIVLNGTPPSSGWSFTWSGCCKTSAIDNLVNPGSAGFEITSTMYPGSMVARPNGTYPSAPRLTGVGNFYMVTGSPMTIPLISDQTTGDSIHTEFIPLSYNGNNLGYSFGFSGTMPLPGIAMGAAFDPIIQDNELILDPNTMGTYAMGILASTYVGGALVSEQLLEANAWIQNPTSSPSGIPTQSIASSTHFYSVNPPSPTSPNKQSINVSAMALDTIELDIMVTDIPGDPTPLEARGGFFHNDLVTVQNTAGGLYKVTIVPSQIQDIANGQGGNFSIQLASVDGGCPISGMSSLTVNVSIPAGVVTAGANICSIAADTTTLKHYVYLNAPENNNGSFLILQWSQFNSATGNWTMDSVWLPDNDTIFEHSISQSLPVVAYALEYYDSNSGSIYPMDDLQVGNLPLTVTSAGNWAQITIPYTATRPPLWVKLYRKPMGSPAGSLVQVDSIFYPQIMGNQLFFLDSVPTAGYYEYKVEAKVDYLCDTTQMNLKNWWYYNTLTNAYQVIAYISVAEYEEAPFVVYPNPTSDWITIDYEDVQSIELWSISGQKIMSSRKGQGRNQGRNIGGNTETLQRINLSEYSTGMYFLIIENTRGDRYTTRVIKN